MVDTKRAYRGLYSVYRGDLREYLKSLKFLNGVKNSNRDSMSQSGWFQVKSKGD